MAGAGGRALRALTRVGLTRPAPARGKLDDGGGGSHSPSGLTTAAPSGFGIAETLLQAFESCQDLSRRRPGGSQTLSGGVLEAPRGRRGGLQRLPGGIC